MPLKACVIVALALAVASCSGAADEPAERAAGPEAARRRETVFAPLTSTIGRAEGVQQSVDAQAAEQRRRIEEASR